MSVGSAGAASSLDNALTELSEFGIKRTRAIQLIQQVARTVDGWEAHFTQQGVSAADLELLRASIDRDALRLSLTATLVEAWLRQVTLDERLRLADLNLNNAERVLATVQARANAGAATWGVAGGSTLTITATNSLVGGRDSDYVGTSGAVALKSGGALVSSPYWDQVTPTVVTDAGRVDILSYGAPVANMLAFATTPTVNSQLAASDLADFLNAGTAVTLQANNDITINAAIITENGSGNGGDLTFTAGRTFTKTMAELVEWQGDRATAGRTVPKGFPRSGKFSG